MRITTYNSVVDPRVQSLENISTVIEQIKTGKYDLNMIIPIIQARDAGKGSELYDRIKKTYLPTYRFNYSFNRYATNKNITASTGLMYLDVDQDTVIPESDLIMAKWKSLSGKCHGLLVKVNYINPDNFREAYIEISNALGIETDLSAAKAIQQTVLSWDPDIYFNPSSRSYTYEYKGPKKVSYLIENKKEEGMWGNDTFLIDQSEIDLRFDNIDEYFKDNSEPYRFFNEKVKICQPYLPFRVNEGSRNTYMFNYLSQFVYLNPKVPFGYLKSVANTFNLLCFRPQLEHGEIEKIIKSVLKLKNKGRLTANLNKERRILFSPSLDFTFKDKMRIVNQEMGKWRSEKTKQEIYNAIEDWNFAIGKITQSKVAECVKMSAATIKRYWPDFKEYVSELNKEFKNSK